MNIADQYFQAKSQIIEYFGIPEELHDIPIIDNRDYYWLLCDFFGNVMLDYCKVNGWPGELYTSKTKRHLEFKNYNCDEDYSHRHIYHDLYHPYFYQKRNWTLLCIATIIFGTPGVQRYFILLDNSKQITQLESIK